MLKAKYCRYFLAFHSPATTSRTTMRIKETFFVKIWDDCDPAKVGIGECAVFRGLSHDDIPDYEQVLADTCRYIHLVDPSTLAYSSMRFGIETALRSLGLGESSSRADASEPSSGHTMPITINGLIWMGSKEEMLSRLEHRLEDGFRCIKLKIGGIDWESELDIIRSIRNRFAPEEVELRLDANEAFSPDTALERINMLAPLHIHSIEQPIKRGQWDEMRRLTRCSPIPIALDEELIGITPDDTKRQMLRATHPAYIILKPALCGGLAEASRWIEIARELGIGWWATSALESNVGLHAIYQWVSAYDPDMPQGLGTGSLYRNNIPSPLRLKADKIYVNPDGGWDYSQIVWK